tara:strand:+ start:930 stop:1313 length:384 start_codon:yes stop_codon:yes gene_type:complete
MGRMAQYLATYQIETGDPDYWAKTMRNVVSPLPADLLAEAVDYIEHNWRSKRPPQPGQLVSSVNIKWQDRKTAEFNARWALDTLDKQPSQKVKETADAAEIDAIMEKHREWVKTRSIPQHLSDRSGR